MPFTDNDLQDISLFALSPEDREKRRLELEKSRARFSLTKDDHATINSFSSPFDPQKLPSELSKFTEQRGVPKPKGVFFNLLDQFGRGMYGSAKFADTMIEESPTLKNLANTFIERSTPAKMYGVPGIAASLFTNDEFRKAAFDEVSFVVRHPVEVLSNVWKAGKAALAETLKPQERLSYRDVFKAAAPVWTAMNPIETEVLGFGMDVVTDPTNAITFGTGNVLKEAASIISKTGKIIPLSEKGAVVFGKALQAGQELGLSGSVTRRLGEEALQDLIEPGVSGNIRKAVETINESVRNKRTLEGQLSRALEEGTIREGQAARVVDSEYIFNTVKHNTLPENIGVKQLGATDEEFYKAVSREGKYGFGETELKQLESGHTFWKIDTKTKKITAIPANSPGELGKTEVQFFLTQDGKVRFLDKIPFGLAGDKGNIGKFRQALTDLEIHKAVRARDLKSREMLKVTAIGESPTTVPQLLGDIHPAKTPIVAVYPGGSIVEYQAQGRHALIDTLGIKPEDVKFMVPGDTTLKTLKETRDWLIKQSQAVGLEQRSKGIIKRAAEESAQRMGISDFNKLKDAGGFKILGQTIIGSEKFQAFFRAMGSNRVTKAIQELPGVNTLKDFGNSLTRTFNLSGIIEKHFPEWQLARQHIEADQLQAYRDAEHTFISLFTTKTKDGNRLLNEEERTQIAKVMAQAQSVTKSEADKLGLTEPTFELAERVYKDTINASTLTVEQKAVVARLRQTYNEFGRLENRVGLLQSNILNYSPQRYELISNPDSYKRYRLWLRDKGVSKKFTAGEVRQFESLEEAEKAGFKPIYDAGKLYLSRFLEHKAALRQKSWTKTLEEFYPKGVPEPVAADLMRLGETFAPKGFGDESFVMLHVVDRLNNFFKKSATVARPAFAVKQIPANFTQMFAAMGVDAFKIADPTVIGDALSYLLRDGKSIHTHVDVFGVRYLPEEIDNLIKQYGVRKHTAIESIGAANQRDFIRNLTSDIHTQPANFDSPKDVFDGFLKLVQGGAKYLELPAFLEDTMRVGAFITGIRAGHSPEIAARIMDKALFNYTSALTGTEQKLRRFLIPFFSYQKFAGELLFKTATEKPGRAAALGKMTNEFFRVWNKVAGGEVLTDAQRNVLPGYLMEQPNVYEGTDSMGAKIFRTFNSVTFMDVLGFMQFNSDGEFSPKDTLKKGVLAQLAPYLKMPLERVVEKEFFTGKALNGVDAGKVGDVDAEKLLTNLMYIGGLHGGATTGAIGRGLGNLISSNETSLELFKKMIGYEEGVDKNTGKRVVWVNPFLLQGLTGIFPGMREAIKRSQNDRDFWDNVLSTYFGVGTSKRNINADMEYHVNDIQRQYNEKLKDVQKYMASGRQSSADDALDDLKNLFDSNATEMDDINDAIMKGELERISPALHGKNFMRHMQRPQLPQFGRQQISFPDGEEDN